MADRSSHLPGYPMPPNNFMNLSQQHQQSPMAYQQSQGAMNPTQQIPGVPNPERQRLWQQYQNRHRAMGGADGMGTQQMNPQMAELMRNQAAQQQQQQQQQQQPPPQLQQAHQFANMGGLAQMNGGLQGQNHLLAMQRQQGMPGGAMGSMPNTQLTPQMAQMLAAQRNGGTNPAMLQMDRQLRLLGKAQTQQPQNSPANFSQAGPSFSGHPNLGQLPFAANVFPPKPNEGRGQVPQGQQQFPPPGLSNGGMAAHGFSNETMQHILRSTDGRPLTADEIRIKASQLRLAIEHEKKALSDMPKPSSPEAVMNFKDRARDIQSKELIFSRMAEHLKILMSQQSQQTGSSNANDGQSQGGLNSLGFPNASQQQSGQQQQMQPNQNWMSHMNNGNLPNQLQGNGLLANQQMLNGVSQNGQNPHQQINSPFHPNSVQSQQQTPSGPTPQQQMLQAFLHQNGGHTSPPSAGSASLSGQGSLGQQVAPHEGQDVQHRPNISFPPVARDKFGTMLQDWWKRNGIKPDARMIMIGNRQIDIHQLHTEVLQFGGVVNVKRHALWNVIAAKMGWTPATISEAGQTQDQIVEQFKNVYEQLLESFEKSYMQAAMKQSLTAPPQQTAVQQGDSSQPNIGLNQSIVPNQQLSSQQAYGMMKLANMSTEQLRSGGYPDNLIQHIEQTRPALQAAWRKLQLQRAQAPQHQQQQGLHQPQGGVLNPSIPFQNQPQGQTTLHRSSPFQPQGAGNPSVNASNIPGFSGGTGDAPVQQQRPPLNLQNLTPQNVHMLNVLQNLQRPTAETLRQASVMIDQMKQETQKERIFRPEHVKHLTDAEKASFPAQFDNLCNIIKDILRLLHMYLAATNDGQLVKGLLAIYDMCDKQRQLLQAPSQVYVLDIAVLQRLTRSAMESRTKVILVVQQVRILTQGDQTQNRPPLQQQNDAGLPPPPVVQQGLSPQHVASSPASATPRPPTVQPAPPQLHQQNLRVPPTETPQMLPARPPSVVRQRGLVASSPNTAESAPSPSASTPLPTAATPSHLQASPHTPKSPKPKTASKPRQQRQRRVSKAVPPNTNATPATPTVAASTPIAATSASTSASAAEPARSPAQRVPSPAEKSTRKRPRDDEPPAQSTSSFTSGSVNEETPSKRMKNDWETVPESQPSKRQIEAERIKTPGEAAKFYSDMTQILELSTNSALPPELQETFAQLVKTVGPGLDIPDATGSTSLSNLTSTGTASPKGAEGDDSFFSFLDFTAFQQDGEKAAADTPELVPTSSTNPSPESGAGSETDHSFVPVSSGSTDEKTKIIDTSEAESRTDLFDNGSDPLRLGVWGEIDGGESGYFNSPDVWRWDSGPNSSGDNSWAIST